MQRADVDCIVDACPFCHLQFDQGQYELAGLQGKEFSIPVLHYSQLLGLALGYSPEELGIYLNRTQNSEFYTKLGEMAENKFPGKKLGEGIDSQKGGVPV